MPVSRTRATRKSSTGQLSPAGRHRRRVVLVPREHAGDALGQVDSVVDRQHMAAGHAEDRGNTLFPERSDNGMTSVDLQCSMRLPCAPGSPGLPRVGNYT